MNGYHFRLTTADFGNVIVQKRIGALKRIVLHPVRKEEGEIAEKIAELALKHKGTGAAVLVYLRTVKDVETVERRLRSEEQEVQMLTGTLRGLERDALIGDPIFKRFLPKAEPKNNAVYLVCTSAGEVGVNISADHLVCDLTPFDSMAQRFGRVNRFGDGNATIDIVYEAVPDPKKTEDRYDQARRKTLELLLTLPAPSDGRRDASPKALSDLPAAERQAAFTPIPVLLPTSDILFDAWALTSIRGKLPGRPPLDAYLHGVAEWEPPETHVAWREEVGVIIGDLLETYKPKDLLEDYPLKPHELLRDNSTRVFDELAKIAKRCSRDTELGRLCPWMLVPGGDVEYLAWSEILEGDRKKIEARLADCTILLPPQVGGLERGMLKGDSAMNGATPYDVADARLDEERRQRRVRVWDDDLEFEGKIRRMRLIRQIELPSAEENEDVEGRSWYWYERPAGADTDGSKSAEKAVKGPFHLHDVEEKARGIAESLKLDLELKEAIVLAARFHDLGKRREKWQRSIGNPNPQEWLAKSGRKMKPREFGDEYRHEFGSLLDVAGEEAFKALSDKPELQDLVLHLIAAHHGRGRPHFTANEAADERDGEIIDRVVAEVPRRFARLQRQYGRWGLAYLESLLRAADYAASASPSATLEDSE